MPPTVRLVGRDPEAELRTRRALDQLAAILNSLLLQGDIVQTGQNSWTIPDTDTTPVFLDAGDGPDERMLVPGQPGPAGGKGDSTALFLEGDPGEDGSPGPPGQPGTAGAAGLTGSPGAQGGVLFSEGDQGDDGTPGATGAQGPAGTPGTNGANGLNGNTLLLEGDAGEDGLSIPGATGAAGANGSNGTNGTNGTNGSNGLPGQIIFLESDTVEDMPFSPPVNDALYVHIAGAEAITGTKTFVPGLVSQNTISITGNGVTANKVSFFDKGSTNSVSLSAANSLSGSTSFRLPTGDGSNLQAIVTDGAGNLSFATVAGTTGPQGVAGPGLIPELEQEEWMPYPPGGSTGSGGSTYAADETTLHLSGTTFSIKSTYAGQTSIVTAGTLTTGVWNATAITATYLPTLNNITAPSGSVSLNSQNITNLLDPTTAQMAATKNYVDMAVAALAPKNDCQAATTAALPTSTYNNGTAGVGATLTFSVAAVLVLDGYTVNLGDRILVKNQASAVQNGIYSVTTLGTVLVATVLTRTLDFDQPGDGVNGALVYVLNGTVNGNTLWSCTTAGSITFGTTNINWSRFLGSTYTADGTTLTLSGTTFSINTSYVGQASIVTVGTLTSGATGAGFTVALGTSTITGTLPAANMPVPLSVTNASGSTATAGDVGYLSATGTYLTTTTANLDAPWCVVLVGGANSASIIVAVRGTVTVTLNANCNAGDYLTTSTTAAQAATNGSLCRAEIFAVALTANAGGAGGQCQALLLTGTRFVPTSNASFALDIASSGNTAWTGTINGSPSSTSVTITAVSGNKNILVPVSTSNWLPMRLYNTTRGSYRLISSTNTSTNVVTTLASVDTWASGDSLTIESQTTTTGTASKMIELDGTQSAALAIVPAQARAIQWEITDFDNTAVNTAVFLHPYEAFASSKQTGCRNSNTGATMLGHTSMKLTNRVFCFLSEAGGAASKTTGLAITGYQLAVP